MTIIKHELKRGKLPLLIWTFGIGSLMAICIFLFPEIKGEIESVGDIFASMGSFSAAFGMDRLNLGTLIGFYSVECGNILGLGGALCASFIAISILSKEEKGKTAEFLLSHPISRKRIITEKLIALFIELTLMNLMIYILSIISIKMIGEDIPFKEINLMHLSFYLLQLELGGICFGISAFIKKGSAGIGLAIAAMMYFLNIIANITESARFLRYITPFGYCEAADIVNNGNLDIGMISIGTIFMIIGIIISYLKYIKKDIY